MAVRKGVCDGLSGAALQGGLPLHASHLGRQLCLRLSTAVVTDFRLSLKVSLGVALYMYECVTLRVTNALGTRLLQGSAERIDKQAI